jgi:hypothetical protein
MKFVSANFGQVLYQIQMDEVRPSSGHDYLMAAQAISQRYHFSEVPTDFKVVLEKGLVFSNGAIALNRHLPIQVTSLGIYNDGILINTMNTDDADLLLEDFIIWATQTFGLRQLISLPRKIYSSNVVVDFEHSIDPLIKGISEIMKLFNESLLKCSGHEFDLHVARLAIGADPYVIRFPAQGTFFIEPRGGLPVSEHRYFSGAPLTTSLHLKLLEQIERLLA